LIGQGLLLPSDLDERNTGLPQVSPPPVRQGLAAASKEISTDPAGWCWLFWGEYQLPLPLLSSVGTAGSGQRIWAGSTRP